MYAFRVELCQGICHSAFTSGLSLVALFKLLFYESGNSDNVPCRRRLSSHFSSLPFDLSTQGTVSCGHRLVVLLSPFCCCRVVVAIFFSPFRSRCVVLALLFLPSLVIAIFVTFVPPSLIPAVFSFSRLSFCRLLFLVSSVPAITCFRRLFVPPSLVTAVFCFALSRSAVFCSCRLLFRRLLIEPPFNPPLFDPLLLNLPWKRPKSINL